MNQKKQIYEQNCVFVFEDLQKLTANKLILACHSPVFELMFYGPMAASEVQITDIKIDSFEQMLNYIETKNINFKSVPNCWSLFYISQKYFLNNLKKACLDYISCNLTLSTLLLSYEYAQLYNLKELANKCWRDILLCAKEILVLDYHMKATTFCRLLDENSINASEDNLMEAAINWAKNESLLHALNTSNKVSILIDSGIFQRLRFVSLGRASRQCIQHLVPNNLITLLNQTFEKRTKISKISWCLRYRFRETYKIERNIPLNRESGFYCTLTSSCKIVVYGIAVAQPHQGGLFPAFSTCEIIIYDDLSRILSKSEDYIETQGDYEVPDLVHFEDSVQLESNVPYKICVKYHSNCKKPNELLCFYVSDRIKSSSNSHMLLFEDDFCGGVVRGISYYVV